MIYIIEHNFFSRFTQQFKRFIQLNAVVFTLIQQNYGYSHKHLTKLIFRFFFSKFEVDVSFEYFIQQNLVSVFF